MDTFLSVLVVFLGGCALVIASGSRIEKIGKRPKDMKIKKERSNFVKNRINTKVLKNENEEAQEFLSSGFVIPPPDEKRIEAVAPKNEHSFKSGVIQKWI